MSFILLDTLRPMIVKAINEFSLHSNFKDKLAEKISHVLINDDNGMHSIFPSSKNNGGTISFKQKFAALRSIDQLNEAAEGLLQFMPLKNLIICKKCISEYQSDYHKNLLGYFHYDFKLGKNL